MRRTALVASLRISFHTLPSGQSHATPWFIKGERCCLLRLFDRRMLKTTMLLSREERGAGRKLVLRNARQSFKAFREPQDPFLPVIQSIPGSNRLIFCTPFTLFRAQTALGSNAFWFWGCICLFSGAPAELMSYCSSSQMRPKQYISGHLEFW